MQSSLPSPTKEQLRRWQDLQSIGCVVCVLNGILETPGDVHHLLSGGKRISHSHTIVLHPWYHRGVTDGRGLDEYVELYGPSLALDKRGFERTFGTERELLEISNELLQKYREVTTT